MKRVLLMILVVMVLLLGCGNTEEQPNEDDQVTNIEINTQNTLEEETSEQEETEQEETEQEELKQEEQEQVVEESEPEAPVWDETKAVKKAVSANVNFRTEPNTECEVIQVLKQWTEVLAMPSEEGWYMVQYNEKIGYVSAQYLIDPADIPKEPEKPAETKPSQSPSAPKVEAIPGQQRNPNSAVVVIDPGHQGSGDSTKEPNGPGSSEMKARVTSGTAGVATGVAEYVLNLDVSLKLKTELENRGYTVYMTRSTHNVNISNMERAQYASSVGADIAVRIHANGSTNSSVRGAETLAPSKSNPYVSHLANASQSLSRCVIDAYCNATGFKNRGVIASDTMTGINWSEIPVTILELGYMSNSDEDIAMQDQTMQNNMVQGIANGIDAYFGF